MTTTIRDLQAQCDELRKQLDAAKQRLTQAEAATQRARTAYESAQPNYTHGGYRQDGPIVEANRKLASCVANERTARSEVRELNRQWSRLSAPLTAGVRIGQLTQASEVQAQRLAAEQTKVDHAQQTVERLEAMLIVEKENLAIAQAGAAQDLLQAVKSGAGSMPAVRVDTSQLDAVETALTAAKSELAQAQHELTAMKDVAATTEHELLVAKSDGAFLGVLLLESDMRQALQQYQQAAHEAHVEPTELAL